jgi:SAM-dependent methyltransferase
MSIASLVTDTGARIALDVARWRRDADASELTLLRMLPAPVLDVGCGPGRITAALARAGRAVLGIDPSPTAIDEARETGAPVLGRSVFAPLPGEGRWASALLLDGNIGIGGDPVRLLHRLRVLLRPGGVVVADVEEGGGCHHHVVRVSLHGRLGPRFPWATVGADAWPDLAGAGGLSEADVVVHEGRRFAIAIRP